MLINVAIIGAGAIAPSHIKAYQEFPGRCKIVALCDIYPWIQETGGEGGLKCLPEPGIWSIKKRLQSIWKRPVIRWVKKAGPWNRNIK